MQFNLLGKTITISEGRRNYMKIVTYYEAMAAQAKEDFMREYDEIFGNIFLISTWFAKYQRTYGRAHYMDNIVKRYVAKTRQYLLDYGVYDLSESVIWNYLIKNNLGVSHLQSEFDSFAKNCDINAHGIEKDFAYLVKPGLAGTYFPDILYTEVMRICDFVLDYLDKHKVVEIQFILKKDAYEAEGIYKNLIDINIPVSKENHFARSLIELDPSRKKYYEYFFREMPETKYEIAAIAQYLFVDLSVLIEQEIRRMFDLNSISCEEDALKMMADLESTMKKFGVSSSSKKADLERILRNFDVKAKTYDGIVYDTRELRLQAEKDDQMLSELHGDVDTIDKNACRYFLMQIVRMQCADAVKSKHLKLLNDRITFIDKEHLDGLLTAISVADENECKHLLEQISQYDSSERMKVPYVTRVKTRIYNIWDTEDFERFTEIFIQTRVSDSAQILKNIALIRDTGRTETKKNFINALYLLNEAEIEAAAKYAVAKENGLFSSIINMGKKESYETLTLNGRVMHPAILNAIETRKSNSKAKQQPNHTQSSSGVRFCTACGAKVNSSSNFCTQCGNRLK